MQGTAKKYLSPETRNKVTILARNKDMRVFFSFFNYADVEIDND